jgi:hypothetical protein
MIANGFYLANHQDPARIAAWNMLDRVFEAIGQDNWYAWTNPLRVNFPDGSNPTMTWEDVEAIAARKLATVTSEVMQDECHCNGVTTCANCVTKWLDSETLEVEIPF